MTIDSLDELLIPEHSFVTNEKLYDMFLSRSLVQLFDPHCKPETRCDVQHWIFHYPFVSRRYGGTRLWHSLQRLVDIATKYVDPNVLKSTKCFYVNIASCGIHEASFRVDDDLQVAPFHLSFEDVCLKLSYDPDDLRVLVQERMQREGVSDLIDQNMMAVKDKNQRVEGQTDFVGFDFTNARLFVRPDSLAALSTLVDEVAPISHPDRDVQGTLDFGITRCDEEAHREHP